MQDVDPQPGRPDPVGPGLVRILAPNPSPMTCLGTNTYLLGEDALGIVDPGPDLPEHLQALLAAIRGRSVTHILVTHAHLDHSALAPALARATGAPVLAFGDARAGRSTVMERLAAESRIAGEEGLDDRFAPDIALPDGARVAGQGWSATALHMPGHMGNHLCFDLGGFVCTGDHVMGWAPSLVSPPDGDMGDYMRSLARLRMLGARRLLPGHGPPVEDAAGRIDALAAHRRGREAAILAALSVGPATAADLLATVYSDLPSQKHRAAQRNLLAHLVDLSERGKVEALPGLSADARFRLVAA